MTRSGEQPVFAGSKAKTSKAKAAKTAKAKDAAGASPATRSATGNLWSGLEPQKSSSLSAAGFSAAPQSESGGLGPQAISMAILGLGLIGLLGGVLVAAVRRQRVQVRSGSGRNDR